ncbi:MAG TPA: glucoamylase family protein [Myxococcota bacterium]|nr:glucoamylase family protein [Myxococcota bacterium]
MAFGAAAQPSAGDAAPAFAPRKREWERAVGGRAAAKLRIHARLEGWPTRLHVDAAELPQDDRAFLLRVARDTWRGLAALRDRENGLPIDHVYFGGDSLNPARAEIGDYTGITTVGLYVISIVAAWELGFIDRSDAVARVRAALETVRDLETWASMFFNYYDTTTLERTSEFLSFVDSAWLTAGAMVVRSAFPDLTAEVSERIQRRNHRFFYDSDRELMSHGYYVDSREDSTYHYGTLYTEARLGSLIAIGKGDVPEEHWFRLQRVPEPDGPGARRAIGRRTKHLDGGYEVHGGWYEWRGVRFLPSWGGSMFEALLPTLLVDERRLAPRSLGRNGEAYVEVQRRFAIEELGLPVWGMSPSATPGAYEGYYREYGVPPLGVLGYEGSVVTPHASALALAFAPEAATANLKRLVELYPIYGDFGFYDAADPRTGRVAPIYLTLDQTMTFIAIANHLRDGVMQKLFAADPIARRALPLLAAEDFFD